MTEFEQKLWMKVYVAMKANGLSHDMSKYEADTAIRHFRDSDRRLTI